LIGLAIIDILQLILDLDSGVFDVLKTEDALIQTVMKVIFYVIISIIGLSILIELYLGGKGIAESKNPSGAKFHISLAKFIAIINIVLAVITVISMFNSTNLKSDFETLSLCTIDIIFMFSYASAAKRVRNGEE
jgi:bacteriorhodopsin